MNARPPRSRCWLGLLAVSGIAIGHALAYLLAAPEPSLRAGLLETTGHGYWSLVPPMAFAAAVAALSMFVADRLGAGPPPPQQTARRLASATAALASVQVAGFLLLEVAERALARGDVQHVLLEPAVGLGVVVQVGVALAMGFLLVVVLRVVQALRDTAGSAVFGRALSVGLPRSRLARAPAPVGAGGATLRGPPRDPPRGSLQSHRSRR